MTVINTDDTTFTLREHETLLEGLERTGHAVEYQCRNGFCGSCRIRLISGSISYTETPLAFVAPDEILPCCCTVTEDITVEAKLIQDDMFGERVGVYPDLFETNK